MAACGAANIDADFLAAAGLNGVARFMLDPRDQREDSEWLEVIACDEGVFGCIGLMACENVCSKNLLLLEVHAYLRRRVLGAKFSRRGAMSKD